MKKEVLVYIFNGFADWESAYVCAELNAVDSPYIVKTIGLSDEPVVSMGGITALPNYTLENYPKDFAALLLIGGVTWSEGKNDGIKPVVHHAKAHGIPIGAICNAVNFLANLGYLDLIQHSGNTAAYMKTQAPNYHGETYFQEKKAVCDDNIITANGTATLEFAREVLHCLSAKPQDKLEEWYQMHKLGYYN